jgi:H+/Cl- antiporter ClcA
MKITRRHAEHLRLRGRLAVRKWVRRSLFLAGGLSVGAAAVLMAKLSDVAQEQFQRLIAAWPHASFLVTPLGFALAALLSRTIVANAQGSGIPQVIAARQIHDPARREALVSLRVAVGKIVLLLLGLLCGASAGREGPTVQVGASIMSALGRFAPFRHKGFLLAGASAGVAAAFNTPLAGIVFGIEEMGRSFEMRTTGLVLGAVIAAGLTSLALVGDYTYFGTTATALPLGRSWLVVPVCAIACGVAGGLFSRLLILFSSGLPGRVGRFIAAHPIIIAAACGLGVALCGWMSGGMVHGTGYAEAKAILHGEAPDAYGFGPWKFAATALSAVSGIPGGIFAPSLAIGAGLAQDLTLLFHSVPVGSLALIGMVSYLTGVVQAPITSFVIVSEMTQDHAMIIPLMAASLIAQGASKLVCPEGLYHALARNFLRERPGAERP